MPVTDPPEHRYQHLSKVELLKKIDELETTNRIWKAMQLNRETTIKVLETQNFILTSQNNYLKESRLWRIMKRAFW